MAATERGQEGPQRARKPMYEDEHPSCSVMLAKIRNEDQLLGLPPHDQFRWLHRFYLVLDRIAEQHRVYKLYGGPHGFMISTGVAEPDDQHAATLLRFSLHLLQAVRAIRLPGMVPLDLIMVLASGPASSGLLGTTSLTYQIVGRSVSVAREIMETQRTLPFIVTSGMFAALNPVVSAEMCLVGSVRLRCCPGDKEEVYTLKRYMGLPLTHAAARAATADATANAEAVAAAPGAPTPTATPVDKVSPAGLGLHAVAEKASDEPQQQSEMAEQQKQQQQAGSAGEGTAGSVAAKDAAAASAAAAAARHTTATSQNDGAGASTDDAGESKRLLQRLAAERRRQRAAAAAAASCSSADVCSPCKPAKVTPKAKATLVDVGELSKRHIFNSRKSTSSLPRNTASSDAWPASDLLLRFEDPVLEASFARYNSESQQLGELAWLFLGVFTAILYGLATAGRGHSLLAVRILQFQLIPAGAALLWRWRHDAFLTLREPLWFVQRFVVLLSTSLPTSFVFAHPSAIPLFAFGLCNLGLEVLTRRLRLHLQLLNSLLVYVAALTMMGLHPEGSHARHLLSPSYLSVHLLVTTLGPIFVTALCDYSARLAFQSQLKEQLKGHKLHSLQSLATPSATEVPACN